MSAVHAIIYDESLVYLHSLDVLPNKLYNSIFYRSDQQQGQFCSSWSYLFKHMHCWKYNSEHRSSLAWSKITKKKTKWNPFCTFYFNVHRGLSMISYICKTHFDMKNMLDAGHCPWDMREVFFRIKVVFIPLQIGKVSYKYPVSSGWLLV